MKGFFFNHYRKFKHFVIIQCNQMLTCSLFELANRFSNKLHNTYIYIVEIICMTIWQLQLPLRSLLANKKMMTYTSSGLIICSLAAGVLIWFFYDGNIFLNICNLDNLRDIKMYYFLFSSLWFRISVVNGGGDMLG